MKASKKLFGAPGMQSIKFITNAGITFEIFKGQTEGQTKLRQKL